MNQPASLIKHRVHGGNVWEAMRRYGLSRDEILDFSVDINPFGPPASIKPLILSRLEDIQHYPEPGAIRLHEAIARYHGIAADCLLAGNGAAELICLVAQAYRGCRALILEPTFGEYAWAMEQDQSACESMIVHESDGFQPDIARIKNRIEQGAAEIVFLCNPNNPTGTAMPKEAVLAIAASCASAGAALVVDESFVEFLQQPQQATVIAEAAQWEHLVVIRSLTKCFAIPGLRLGYLVASPTLVERLGNLQPPWPLNSFAAAAGEHLLGESEYLSTLRRSIIPLRHALQQQLAGLEGLKPFGSSTHFFLCKITRAELTADRLCEQLACRGLLVRNCSSFNGLPPQRFVRIAARRQQDNERLAGTLREILANG